MFCISRSGAETQLRPRCYLSLVHRPEALLLRLFGADQKTSLSCGLNDEGSGPAEEKEAGESGY